MMFRELKQGDTIYIYDRVAVGLSTENVVSVSAPHMDKNNTAIGMVVDVNLSNTTYSFKDASEIGYTANLVISPNKSLILREVENHKASNENLLAKVDSMRDELTKIEKIIDVLSPERKEKRMMEDRLNRIEAMMERLINSKSAGNGGKGNN